MKAHYIVLLVLFASGCIGNTPAAPVATSTTVTTTTVEEEYSAVMPSDTLQSTSTTVAEDGVAADNATTTSTSSTTSTSTTLNPLIKTFTDNGGRICTQDGKPIIRMYGKTDCEHCVWVAPIFDKVVGEYMDNGSIIAHHWLFDRNDDTLTAEDEGSIPDEDSSLFFGTNQQTVPYFNFGCRFTRSGNGYYVQNRPDLEEAEFKAVIGQIVASPLK